MDRAEYGGAKLAKWETLSPEEKKLFIRQADVFAAYVAYTDNEIGRVIQEIQDEGKLDNTLIIYICGDNGTSAEGSLVGTPFDMAALEAITMPVADQLKYYDVWGSDKTQPHMAVAWAWAFDTPFKWTKQIASHFGGTRQGLAISWPGHITDVGGIRTQFHHLIDIAPTILQAVGYPGARDGQWRCPATDRRREHGLHVRQSQRERAVHPHDAVFRDDGKSGDLPRRLDRDDDAAARTVDDGRRQDAGRRQRLPLGALQHHRGLFGVQRPRGQDASTSSRTCRSSSWSRRPSTTCCRWTTTCSQRALAATSERDRRQDRLHVHRGSVRHA